ncbi:YbbR-like domain-containing protein [Xanthomarina sp. F1114]|uniref:YbbR-like domain-containing protein n=1 Tax=Xanthomarina sp. F1114 TaxID=2996019 RepID=UPI00225E5316|nr:YbbR-like domain-containing protein [Xanthomarina sp. F1114]MCX7547428.1 YbbR-like domain-containing protein [Xanthomarina sp. F1114]
MLEKIRTKILASVKNKKINVFILFVLFSFIVLLLLKLSNTFTNTITFNIKKTGIPEKHLVLNNNSQKLHITLKSQGFNLLKYYFKKPEINIDFGKHITKNKEFYVWNKHQGFSDLNEQFSKSEEIVSITPDTLRFRYDVNTVKKVPVKLKGDFHFNKGFDLLDSIKIVPDSIKIIGPDILVSEITTIETDSIQIKDIKSNIDQVVNLKLPKNENGNLSFSLSKVAIHGTVEKFTEGHLKVPVSVINIPKNLTIKYFPKKVYVTYYTSLSNYNNVQATDFEIVCDYNKLEDGSDFLIPELSQKPKNVKHIKLSQEHIEFIIIE